MSILPDEEKTKTNLHITQSSNVKFIMEIDYWLIRDVFENQLLENDEYYPFGIVKAPSKLKAKIYKAVITDEKDPRKILKDVLIIEPL